MNEEFLAKKISDAIQNVDSTKPESYDAPAEVLRIENQTAWVHIDGGVAETPVKLTINAKVGDTVQVRVTNGHAFIIGNVTAPPTDDSKAEEAIDYAQIANNAANEAVSSAHRANEAAQDAQATAESVRGIAQQAKEDAERASSAAETAEGKAQTAIDNAGIAQDAAVAAQNSANNALLGLSQVESVVDTLNWLTEHSKVTEDTTPVANKNYYIKNQDNTFTLVTDTTGKNPAQEGWYEMDDAISNYVASHLALTDDGLYVMVDGTKWKVLIASDGVYILDENNNAINTMNADGNQIGYDNETHAKIDYHSMQLIDKEGNVYFYASDLRSNHEATDTYGEGFYYVATETFTGTGTRKEFTLQNNYLPNKVTAKINGTATTAFTYITNGIKFNTAPANNATVEIEYASADVDLKAYTLGIRVGNVGVLSLVEGNQNGASGRYSHAEGEYTQANGYASHSEGAGTQANIYMAHAEGEQTYANGYASHTEGQRTIASREAAHAEGIDTEANGFASHSQNWGTKASSNSQTAIGRYNEEDAANQYAFIIGNGSDDNNRSNALTVDWNGGLNASGDIVDGNNNILANKVNASALAAVATSGNYNDLSNKPNLAAVATSGDYDDLSNKPTIPPTPEDYIIEQGKSGNWRYRKWNSGKIEAWCKGTFSYGATTQVGQLHRAAISSTFPTVLGFSGNAIVVATMGAAQSVVTVNMSVTSSGAGLTGYVFRPTAQSGSSTVAISLYVWED